MKNYAVVFPGQGSQFVGMLSDISSQFPEVLQTFAQASDLLGYDLWKLVSSGPAEKLDLTLHTQPALLCASVALWQILQSRCSNLPVVFAGHSLGEYSALVCAKALSFAEGVKLVAARAQYMQEAVAPGLGAMAAIIGLDDDAVKMICDQAKENEVLAPANFNSPGQIVIAGQKNAVERAIVLAKEQGARIAILLPVSVASHCPLMQPAAEHLSDYLQTVSFAKPRIAVINNVDVKFYEDEKNIRDGLIRQLVYPVRWVETILTLKQQGITHILECGPGKVLTGLSKRIDKQLILATTHDIASLSAWLSQNNGNPSHASIA